MCEYFLKETSPTLFFFKSWISGYLSIFFFITHESLYFTVGSEIDFLEKRRARDCGKGVDISWSNYTLK